MNCPTCGSDEHRVVQTKSEADAITRLRECASCRKRWHTTEVPHQVFVRTAAIVQAFETMKTAVEPGA